jgi:hypothetical protein
MSGARFAARGPKVDTLSNEPIEAIDGEATPRDAGGKNEGSCPDDVITIEKHFARCRTDASDGARNQNLGSKPPRLLECATGELVARNAVGKSEIVLDPCRGPGLSTGCLTLNNDRAQPFRCAVDRTSGRTSTCPSASRSKGPSPSGGRVPGACAETSSRMVVSTQFFEAYLPASICGFRSFP